MKDTSIPPYSADEVRALLTYIPETGKLYWKERPVSLFKVTKGRSVEHSARNWNAIWAGKEAFTATTCATGYKVGAIWGRNLLAHRVIWLLAYGEWPNVIDHINGDGADNRLHNLRNVSQAENTKNASLRSDNKSGHPGVIWCKRERRWLASVYQAGKRKDLGMFRDKGDAIAARTAARADWGYSETHGRVKA